MGDLEHQIQRQLLMPSQTFIQESGPVRMEAPLPAVNPVKSMPEAKDLQSWGKVHGVSNAIMSNLKAEAIDTIDELVMLSDSDIASLCQGERLGNKARFKLLVKQQQ